MSSLLEGLASRGDALRLALLQSVVSPGAAAPTVSFTIAFPRGKLAAAVCPLPTIVA
jgi:hypothetical protein